MRRCNSEYTITLYEKITIILYALLLILGVELLYILYLTTIVKNTRDYSLNYNLTSVADIFIIRL